MTFASPEFVSRRGFVSGSGALLVSFAMADRGLAQQGEVAGGGGSGSPIAAAKLPGSLADQLLIDAWIRIDSNGQATVFTGKAELGQGVKTAILQIAAEELELEPRDIKLVTADTSRTPNEGYTAGSQSMQNSGTAVRNAAAQARQLLIGEAARRWQLDDAGLSAEAGKVRAGDGRQLGYGELVSEQLLHLNAEQQSRLKPSGSLCHIGKPMQRVDIPAKVTGGAAYVRDLRLHGMLHARVVRPAGAGSRLLDLDTTSIERMPGVVKVVRDGNFLGVLARREWQAVKAMRALVAAAHWSTPTALPNPVDIPPHARRARIGSRHRR